MVTSVPKRYLPLIWEDAKKCLSRWDSRSGNGYGLDDIEEMISEEKQQLWLVVNDDEKIIAAIVTQVWDAPKKKVCDIVACGGDTSNALDDYMYDSMKEIEDFARLNHCDSVRVEGRKGWSKFLKPYGFREKSIVIEKEL